MAIWVHTFGYLLYRYTYGVAQANFIYASLTISYYSNIVRRINKLDIKIFDDNKSSLQYDYFVNVVDFSFIYQTELIELDTSGM